MTKQHRPLASIGATVNVRSLFLAIAPLAFGATVLGQGPAVLLEVRAIDMDGRALSDFKGRVAIDGGFDKELTEGSAGAMRVSLPKSEVCVPDTFRQVHVRITSPPGFTNRHIEVYAFKVCRGSSYDIHLAKPADRFTESYLDRAMRVLTDGGPDPALAYLEVALADLKDGERNHYACRLKHQYASALQSACVEKSYATCDQAYDMYRELDANECKSLLNLPVDWYKKAEAILRDKKILLAMSERKTEDAFALNEEQMQEIDAGLDLSNKGSSKIDALRRVHLLGSFLARQKAVSEPNISMVYAAKADEASRMLLELGIDVHKKPIIE